MGSHTDQGSLFPDVGTNGVVELGRRFRLEKREGYCVVSVRDVPIAHFAANDRMGIAHAMVALVSQGHALQVDVAKAFGCHERTLRRNLRRFEEGGLAALGRPRGYPRGRARTPLTQRSQVDRWKRQGLANREIARRLRVDEKAVRKLAKRLGWAAQTPEQQPLAFPDADPKLSGAALPGDATAPPPDCQQKAADEVAETIPAPADPKLSGPEADAPEPPTRSFDGDPAARNADRILAALGLLDDAAPLFGTGSQVVGAGVLLALPALEDSGVLGVARQVYGSLAPAFYGLRTTMLTLLLMALMRIKRPEQLKEHSPRQLGQLLGLDRARGEDAAPEAHASGCLRPGNGLRQSLGRAPRRPAWRGDELPLRGRPRARLPRQAEAAEDARGAHAPRHARQHRLLGQRRRR